MWGVPQLQFLGHYLDASGIRPLEDKVQIIRDFPQPSSQRKLREFLGLVNFYRRFLPGCATVVRPLNELLSPSKDSTKDLHWSEDATAAFTSIKEMLAKATLLVHPNPDAPTNIMTDASSVTVGAVLQQFIGGELCPIAYYSRKLKPTETWYNAFDRELLAVYVALKHFRHFM